MSTATGEVKGSLFHFLDHCATNFGKRQLKRWLLSPLMNTLKIKERQDCVQALIDFTHQRDKTRMKMKKLPDLEKLLARVFTYSIKQRIKAVYFEDMNLKKCNEFRTLLKHFRQLPEYLKELIDAKDQF